MQNTLRRRLLFLLLAAQVATVLARVLVSGRFSSAAEADHTARLLSANASESAEAIRAHLEPAEALVDLTSNLLISGDLEREALQDTFHEAITRTPQMSGAFLASPDGDFLFVSRDGDDFLHKYTTVDGPTRSTSFELLDEDGELLDAFEDPDDNFDPTVRPWFLGAVETQTEAVWTQPYVFFTSGDLGITASRAVVRNGELVGVVGADIALGELSEFLRELDTSTDGGTILVDRRGTVIAHPNADLLRVPDGEGFRTVSILELQDSYAQSATSTLLNANAVAGVQDFDDETAGESRVAFENVEFGNVDWTLGVYAPSGSIVAELTNARGQERALTAIVGVLTILLVLLFALPATRDIDDLEEIASTDTLTGLPNRRVILDDAVELAAANGERALAMLDIDHFKQVNQEYGHQVGDEVLKAVASRLSSALPEGAAIGRIGGEEFLVLLPDHDEAQATTTAERLRSTVRNVPVETGVGTVSVSVSIGVASATRPSNRDTLVSIADTALREAKRSSRYMVVTERLNEQTAVG